MVRLRAKNESLPVAVGVTVEISFKRVQRWVSRVSKNFLAGNLRRMDELHLDFPFAGSRTLRDLPNAGGRGSSFQFCTARGRCRWCARARSHGVLLITKYMLDAGAFRPKLKAADKALRRLNLHQNPAETLHIRRLENGLERPGGRLRPASRGLASLVDVDAFAGELTRGSFKTIPASVETTNTQRFEADSLADETVSGEPVCEANSLLSGKKQGISQNR